MRERRESNRFVKFFVGQVATFVFALYSIYKWIFRLLFGSCEIERVCCTQQEHSIEMTLEFERAFNNSKQLHSLKMTIANPRKHSEIESKTITVLKMDYIDEEKDAEEIVNTILKIKKKVNEEYLPMWHKKPWVQNMSKCVRQMIRANKATRYLTQLKSTPVVKGDTEHEKLLNQLWMSAFPQIKRNNRITNEWQMLGFQGTDPCTDFRGMGLLALLNLHYFVSQHSDVARTILAESRSAALIEELEQDPKWYAFAISGINFTADLYNLAAGYHVIFRRRLYTCSSDEDVLRVFHEIYVKFWILFHELWKKEKVSIMEFNKKKDEIVRMFFAL